MRHRRALELPFQESATATTPQELSKQSSRQPQQALQQSLRQPPPQSPQHSPQQASQQAPRQARSSRSGALPPGDLLRPIADRAGVATRAPAELWLAVHLTAATQPTQQDLERLGARAQRFTPRISLDPPDGLLLEVKGSLHLFGGVEGLSREMAGECSCLRMPCTLAVAPTPLAALALARAGRAGAFQRGHLTCPRSGERPRRMRGPGALPPWMASGTASSEDALSGSLIVTDPAQLVGKLSPLPLATLRWPQDTLDRLARIGVRTIGEALRLPRAGFARRFGTAQLQALDRLTGRASDLKDRFEVRARFRRRRELIYELESHAALLAVLAPLLEELGEFLQARQCGVLTLECRLRHRAVPPTCCVLRLAAPLADPAQLGALLAERLSALVLPEPVRACELRSGPLVSRVLGSGGLWQAGEHGGGVAAQAPELIERLRARLGFDAVYGLQIVEDHRPEAAWKVREPVMTTSAIQSGLQNDQDHFASHSESESPWPFGRRPLWLLPAPRLLNERDGLPRRRGALRLLGEPERIETGWWDGGEVARDYYAAVDARGARLWVFRERESPHRWFLHGVFG